jgi:acetolactate synthase-1/2/3 large subunit
VTQVSEVKEALVEAMNHPGPVFLDFIISEDEGVFPFVPTGKGLTEMLGRGL